MECLLAHGRVSGQRDLGAALVVWVRSDCLRMAGEGFHPVPLLDRPEGW